MWFFTVGGRACGGNGEVYPNVSVPKRLKRQSLMGRFFSVIHTDMHMIGCSETEGAFDISLDEEDMIVADFIAERVVDTRPSFVDHISFGKDTFQVAMGNLITCRRNLNITQKALKDQPLESGTVTPPSRVCERMCVTDTLRHRNMETQRY